jgi:DNA-binding GntR family transcriptional regulator
MCLVPEERLRPSRAVRASRSVDGLILLDVDGGLVLASNAVGARIWQLIEEQRTTDDIARQLAEDYTIPIARARHDVHAFIANLIARGLLAGDRPR